MMHEDREMLEDEVVFELDPCYELNGVPQIHMLKS